MAITKRLSVVAALLATTLAAHGQSVSNSQVWTGSPLAKVSGSNPLPVTGSFSATTAATASSTLPSLSAGSQAIYESLSGGQFVNPIFGTTIVDSTHGLPVNIIAGGGSGGTSATDEASFTWGSTAFTPMGGFYQTTATSNALTTGQSGAWQFTAQRAGFVNLRDSSGGELGLTGTPLFVQSKSGAFPSGTFATGSMVDLLTFQGTKAAGTAAANSLLAGLLYNSSPITLTTGQQAAFQADANGYLKVNVAAGGAGGGAITAASGSYSSGAFASGSIASGAMVDLGSQADAAWTTGSGSLIAVAKTIANATGPTSWAAGTLGAMANYGTSPGAVLVPGMNAFITNTPTVTANAGTNLNTSALGTSANQSTIISSLSTIDTDIKGPIAAGTADIGTVQPFAQPAGWVKGTTSAMTGTTSTVLLAAVSAKVLYVTHISCVNSHATVGTFVTVQDGSGGTALATLAAAAVYGGDEQTSSTPLFWTTSGNGLYVADVTTGANVICNASGFAR